MVRLLNNKFSEILGRRRLKITAVAKGTGLSRTTLTSLYYGRTKSVTLDVLDKLCAYLDCDVQDIFEYEKEAERRKRN